MAALRSSRKNQMSKVGGKGEGEEEDKKTKQREKKKKEKQSQKENMLEKKRKQI